MSVIEVNHLTKDYGQDKGVFDISFQIHKGEILGFIGPNGSGKTTTIRHLMGFIKAQQGSVRIFDLDCFLQAKDIAGKIGYLPGEMALIDDMKGIDFIHFIAKLKGIKDLSKAEYLIDFFQLDAHNKIKRMSKGMKQKIGLVIAFMQDAPVLILDEPTSGLDPLMQNQFVELILQEKKEGKTILMSSHIFEEVENTCDRVIMIKDGHIVEDVTMQELRNHRHKHYQMLFKREEDAIAFVKKYSGSRDDKKVDFYQKGNINQLIKEISRYDIEDISIKSQTLEEVFIQYYGGKKDVNHINEKRNQSEL